MINNNKPSIARLALQLKCAAGRRSVAPALWLLSDALRLKDPRSAIRALPPGSGFIFRHYGAPGRAALGRELRLLCRSRRIVFLVAGDLRLAQRLRADGAHLPEGLAHRIKAARNARANWLITASAHGAASLRRAAIAGADAVFLSPVFATASHPGAKNLGPVRFARLANGAGRPVIALGGVTAGTARRLRGSRASGIAAISALDC